MAERVRFINDAAFLTSFRDAGLELDMGIYELIDNAVDAGAGIVTVLLEKIGENRIQITVYDDGEQRRCWTYIDDALDGLMALATSDRAAGEIVNLGSNFESSIKDLAFKIKELTGSESEVAFIPYDETRTRNGLYEDLVYRAPELEKIRTLVGYDPKVNLDEALVRIIDDYKR